jgi:hypothetical protein
MKLLKLFVAAALVSGILLTVANAKPDYAKKENKKCVDCHEGGKAIRLRRRSSPGKPAGSTRSRGPGANAVAPALAALR